MDYQGIITIEPGKRGGKACIRGLRITVDDVLSYLAGGMSQDEILRDFPYLQRSDIEACLHYSAERRPSQGVVGFSEILPVPRSSIESLDRPRLVDYLTRALRDPGVPSSDEEWIKKLEELGVLIRHGGLVHATIAGLTLFGYAPRRYLRHAGIRLMIFEGDDVDSRALLDETLDGSLVGLWRMEGPLARLAQQDHGLLERLSARLEPYITTELPVNAQFRRDKAVRFPLDVIRELVVNAMAHRDWTRAIETEVRVFDRRLEVISPGALHNSMTVDKMIAGQRYPRNPLIVEALRDYGYIEARGMGVRTKVISMTREYLGTEPVFEATEDYLKTILFLP